MHLKLFASCKIIKGSNRSLIIDLQRETYTTIPNDLYNILSKDEFVKIIDIKRQFNFEFDNIIDEYVEFLFNNEFVFFTKKPALFPKLNEDFLYPFEISNMIIEYQGNYNLIETMKQVVNLKCKNVEIIFLNDYNFSEILLMLKFLDNTDSIICNLNLFLNYQNYQNEDIENASNLFDDERVSSLCFYNYNNSSKIINIKNDRFIYFYKNNISSKNCGLIQKEYFAINNDMFNESLNHNSCLHKKISIDKDGYIRNCPSMPQHFGNIKDTTLEEALNHPDFKKYWNVNKDMIAVCKDCEFRHICTDCRAYTERAHFEGDLDLSKPLKCGYNPYTNEWAEWSTNPLKEKAIEYYGMQDLVKKDV